MRIGIIGLGAMGSVISKVFQQNKIHILGFDIYQKFTSKGYFKQADNLNEFNNLDKILTILPDGKAVHDIVKKLVKIKFHGDIIDLSSSHPSDTIQTNIFLNKSGCYLMDAPVSGGVERAKKQSLMIMFGGCKRKFNANKKLLSLLGNTEYVGPVGSGHAMKSLNNYVSAAGLIASFQAIATAKNFGIEPEKFQKIINASTGKNNTTEVKIDKFILNQKFNSGFSLKLMAKDINNAKSIINKNSIQTPLTDAISFYLENSLQKLGNLSDHTELYKLIEINNGKNYGKI